MLPELRHQSLAAQLLAAARDATGYHTYACLANSLSVLLQLLISWVRKTLCVHDTKLRDQPASCAAFLVHVCACQLWP